MKRIIPHDPHWAALVTRAEALQTSRLQGGDPHDLHDPYTGLPVQACGHRSEHFNFVCQLRRGHTGAPHQQTLKNGKPTYWDDSLGEYPE